MCRKGGFVILFIIAILIRISIMSTLIFPVVMLPFIIEKLGANKFCSVLFASIILIILFFILTQLFKNKINTNGQKIIQQIIN